MTSIDAFATTRYLTSQSTASSGVATSFGILDYAYPETDFYAYLKRLIDAGLEERIMFGSDNMVWPEAIGVAIERIRRAPFLTERQKRLILHDNATRFLRVEG